MTIRNLLLALTVACAPAFADIVTVTLDSASITAIPGHTITFSGTIMNNDSATVDLNNISIDIGSTLISADISPFGSCPLTAAGNTRTSDCNFFNVTIASPYTDPPGMVGGTLTIQGGIEGANGYDPSVQDDLGSASFSVNVMTPEPSEFGVLLTALAALLLCKVRRRHTMSA